MRSIKIQIVLLLCFVGINIGGCKQQEKQDNSVQVKESSSLSVFLTRVSSVRLIPIYDDYFLGSRVELVPIDNSFILCDMSNDIIYRYDNNGSFLNTIGRKGNGPGEYNHISNIQVIDSLKVAVISPFSGINYYSLDGEYLGKDDADMLGLQSVITDDYLLTYYGYMPAFSYRLRAIYKSSSTQDYLPTENPVIPYSTTIPQLTVYGKKVFIVDSYNNVLYYYEHGELGVCHVYDFGKYQVPDDYYKAKDPYKGAEALMKSEFAFIQRYLMSDYCSITEVAIQKHSGLTFSYGLNIDNQWSWFGEDGNQNEKVFEETPRVLVGNTLYTLIDPDRFEGATTLFYDYLSNKSEVESIDKGRLSYVIGEITLL